MTCHRNRILITDKIPSNSPSSNLNLLRKLLSHNINALQLAGFALANLLGMMIVVLAVQFFFDVRPLFKEGDGLMAPTRIVVAKHISSLRTVTKTPPSFTDEDIEDLRRQPFAERVDAFVSSQYEVIAAVGIQSWGQRSPLRCSSKLFPMSVLTLTAADGLMTHQATLCPSSCQKTISTSITSVMPVRAVCPRFQKTS